MDLYDVFSLFKLDKSSEVKLFRHTDHKVGKFFADVEKICSDGELEAFQSSHTKHVLGQGYLASFIGEEGRISRFVGMWEIKKHGKCGKISIPSLPTEKYADYLAEIDGKYCYEMIKVDRFDSLIDRLIIQWPLGPGHTRWLITPKKEIRKFNIHSIRAVGLSQTFPGFDELIISYDDLLTLVNKGDGGLGWTEALRSTRGVYLITDTKSGDLYVGSATGKDGIWGRWKEYGKTVHGGNKVLKKRCEENPDFRDGLQYSILETLSNLTSDRDGLVAEQRWKRKLGKKAISLNAN